jgi:signal transduction histidine kinase
MGTRWKNFFRTYWPAGIVLVVGLAISCVAAIGLHDEAKSLDEIRFRDEAQLRAAFLEKSMERYEERLGRLADYCGMSNEISRDVWSFRSTHMTDIKGNLPSAIHVVYCPKVLAKDFEAHWERGCNTWRQRYQFDPVQLPGREYALPAWQCFSEAGFEPILPGTDLAIDEACHPSFANALKKATWISAEPWKVPRKGEGIETGFWFVQSIYPTNQVVPGYSFPGETAEQGMSRRAAFYGTAATGMLAAFISTDRLIDETFNDPNRQHRLYVKLYAATNASPGRLFISKRKPPLEPRHRLSVRQQWYGRAWSLEFTSTPLFERESPRHRAWLVLWGGAGMSVLAAGLVGVSLRGRSRQERMTVEVIEARDALSAADKEREKLGHDLHDGAIQSLYALQLRLERTVQHMAEKREVYQQLTDFRAELDTVIAELRRFVKVEEEEVPSVDLQSVLRALSTRAAAGGTPQIEVTCDSTASARLTPSQAVQVANIAREALSNAVRHGDARHVEIKLNSANGVVELKIADDGSGFELSKVAGAGVGLTSMAQRAKEIGASFEIDSAPGAGTTIVARIPAPSDEPES